MKKNKSKARSKHKLKNTSQKMKSSGPDKSEESHADNTIKSKADNMKNTQVKKELMELKHDALPGYRPVFMVVFSISLLYMAFILLQPCF